jgi:hypothetical protein
MIINSQSKPRSLGISVETSGTDDSVVDQPDFCSDLKWKNTEKVKNVSSIVFYQTNHH